MDYISDNKYEWSEDLVRSIIWKQYTNSIMHPMTHSSITNQIWNMKSMAHSSLSYTSPITDTTNTTHPHTIHSQSTHSGIKLIDGMSQWRIQSCQSRPNTNTISFGIKKVFVCLGWEDGLAAGLLWLGCCGPVLCIGGAGAGVGRC